MSNWVSVWCAHEGGCIGMKSLAYSLAFFLIVGFAAGQSDNKTTAESQTAAHGFDYDSKQALDVHDKIIEQFDGGTLHDITYASPKGGPWLHTSWSQREKGVLPLFSLVIGET